MKIQGRRFAVKKSKASVSDSAAGKAKAEIKALIQAINTIGICENNWGQGTSGIQKWYYLAPGLLKSPKQLLSLRPSAWERN